MKKELQDKLFEKYPKIFRQKDLPSTETCMCLGITCGDGWYDIIDLLCFRIQNYVDSCNRKQIEAVQVKSKFGSLKFYTNSDDPFVCGMISFAESMSLQISEQFYNNQKIRYF